MDTEFIDNPSGLYLLSIGLVREDGKKYYAEVNTDHRLCNEWVRKNVLIHMNGPYKHEWVIAKEIAEFVGEKPEFWAYFHAYDWVLLCRLFGGMTNLPKDWPQYCHDILIFDNKKPWPQQTTPEHHALNDAEWVKEVYEWVVEGNLDTDSKSLANCKLRFAANPINPFPARKV